MILHGKLLIKSWTKQLIFVATSAAEAELYKVNRAPVTTLVRLCASAK